MEEPAEEPKSPALPNKTDISISRNVQRRSTSPSRMTTSVGKTRIKRYPRRHSKPHNMTVGHERPTIDKDKKLSRMSEPQGFLSIVKINTRADFYEPPVGPSEWRQIETKKSLRACEDARDSDLVVERGLES